MSAPSTLTHPADLDPFRVDHRTYLTRRRGRIDAGAVLILMICLLTLIPARLILPGLSEVGRPAIVVCLLMWFWWLLVRFNPRLVLMGPQPVRWAVLVYLLSLLVSYAIGYFRGLTSMEANAADMWMLSSFAFCGVILMTADGLRNWQRLRSVLVALVWCCVFMSVIGLLQASLPVDIVRFMNVPGLENRGWIAFEIRGGGIRVPSTTSHYLELAATLVTGLPFAVHFALFSDTRKRRRWYTVASVLIAAGIMVTITRTGIVCMGIGLLVLLPLWKWRLRYNVLVLIGALFAALIAVKPSFASTFIYMFRDAGQDPSVTSRQERYGLVGYYFAQRPWFGRGSGTWVPPQYQYLDNQWLGTALTNGLVGCAALATLHIVAIVLAAIALRRASSREDKHLCAALIGTQLMGAFASYTFDTLAFSTYATVLALTIGMSGAVWRFTHRSRQVRTSSSGWLPLSADSQRSIPAAPASAYALASRAARDQPSRSMPAN